MILDENYTLPNGVDVPKIALGTWRVNNSNVQPAVIEAIKLGYRHIDTAQVYRNEAGVGEGIRTSNRTRNELFVTTKLAAEAKSFKAAAKAIDKSLQKMKLDYIDMMLIHSPQPWMKFNGPERYFEGNREAWRALETAYDAGKLRAIGVSNFVEQDLENIISTCKIAPMVNQVLAHISNTPFDLIEYCENQGILVEAYSPIGHGELLKNETIKNMATKYGVSIPQLSIRYLLQLGLLPLPKTTNPAHMKNNSDVAFVITDEDMRMLKHIEKIQDYGDASIMPVFGGKMNLSTIFKMMIQSFKR